MNFLKFVGPPLAPVIVLTLHYIFFPNSNMIFSITYIGKPDFGAQTRLESETFIIFGSDQIRFSSEVSIYIQGKKIQVLHHK